jgi:signal transduction histidine kinase
VTVRLDCTAASACLEIADNGTGFDPAAVTGGFGLQSMRERLAAVGGSLAVESAPGRGTTIRATAPIRKEI